MNLIGVVTTSTIELLARGGGGGSGGSSGGGGGGSIIILIGYLPTSFVTNKTMKRFGSKAAVIVGLAFSIVWGIGLWLVAGGFIGFLLAAASISGFFGGYYGLYGRIKKRAKRAKKQIAQAAALDPAWNQESMKTRVAEVFYNYQKDWSELNTANIANYTSEYYSYHNWLMLTALHQLSRRNIMSNVELTSIEFVDMHDNELNSQDTFTSYIEAKAVDQLQDTRSQNIIYTDKSNFSEYWTFIRHEHKGWVLSGIQQVTQKTTSNTYQISSFAKANDLFFSIDWGWLLLPKFGNIFSKADFKKSDINNHCIGTFGNEIVQLYSYLPSKDNNNNQKLEIIVAQIALPNKNYGRIVIEHKQNWLTSNVFSFLKRKPKGLNKLQVEAIEINKRFNIYASDVEQVTTFELLNPLYMQYLIDTPGKVDIEVYDNTIFIYSRDKKVSYDDLFKLLVRAHKELVR